MPQRQNTRQFLWLSMMVSTFTIITCLLKPFKTTNKSFRSIFFCSSLTYIFFLLCIKLALLDWKCTFKNSCFLPLQTQLYLAHWYAQRTWHFCVRGAYSEQTATISTINGGFALRWRRFPSQSLQLWIFYWFGRKVISALLSWVKTSAELLAPKLCILSSFHTALVQGNTVVLHVGSHCPVTPVPQAHPDRMKGKTSLDWLSPSRFVFSFPFVSVYSKRTWRKI